MYNEKLGEFSLGFNLRPTLHLEGADVVDAALHDVLAG